MPAYIIATINVTNPEKYQEYVKLAGPASQKHGGRFLVRGRQEDRARGRYPVPTHCRVGVPGRRGGEEVLPFR